VILRSSTTLPFARVVFEYNPSRAVGVCNPHVLYSNIVTDDDYIYYADNLGPEGRAAIWRRSKEANAQDASQLLVDLDFALSSAELLVFGDNLLALVHIPNSIFDAIVAYNKTTGAVIDGTVAFNVSNTMRDLQWDGRFVYWIGPDGLYRYDTVEGDEDLVVPGASVYLQDGYFVDCTPVSCEDLAYIYYSKGNQIFYDEIFEGILGDPALYTSEDPNASIGGITRDFLNVFWVERRTTGVGFGDTENRIYRHAANAVTSDLIFGPVDTNGLGWDSVTNDWTWLYFRDQAAEQYLRIPNDASAIAIRDLAATGIEITQGLQHRGNGIRLIENKATTVRLYVESQSGADIPNVTAILSGSSQNGGFLGTLRPVNPTGLINVVVDPQRNNLAQSFLFELPLHWTNQGALTLSGTVNPDEVIVEDDIDNNSVGFGPISFSPQARLNLAWYNFSFPFGGVINGVTDDQMAASMRHMRQLYPIGEADEDGNGLHFVIRNVYDAELSAQVGRTDPVCQLIYPLILKKDQNMCASDYVHARLQQMRQEGWISADMLAYANIADGTCGGTACPFTRGYATNGVGSGPADSVNYAAHEVGHLLGRAHPAPGSDTCGQSADDTEYPYQGGDIEHDFLPAETRTAGLRRLADASYEFLDGVTFGDTMTYCDPTVWISEYTFEGMYSFLAARNPQLAGRGSSERPSLVEGDWLLASGLLIPAADAGGFVRVRRMSAVADATAPAPGGFTLELLDAADSSLATHSFAGSTIGERPGEIRFDLVVPFAAGTAGLRVTESGSGQVLATKEISANAPEVSGVTLLGAPNPVDGTIGLAWDADDVDDDPLIFDVLATRDGGTTFDPVQLGVTSTSMNLDTTLLGGGTNVIRVVASDGALTGFAESNPFEVVARPPVPIITEPAPNTQVQWGQVVTLSAEIVDLQDDVIPDESITWANAYGEIGIGRLVKTDQLEVGENLITVTATNSLGESGVASVTIFVGDDILPVGPRIAAAPANVSWHIATDATEVQADLLQVENSGGGSLSFDIVSDSDWVTVDDASGLTDVDAPASLIVRADPAAVAAATTGVATLTLQNTADPEDVIVVAVQLSRGNTFDGPPTIVECDPETGECTDVTICGNSIVETGETCDDGEFVRGDVCGADCELVDCGDADDSGTVTATDALVVLRAAVGLETCAGCVCNVDGEGAGASATDALRVLKAAVGQAGQLSCAACEL
jgi:cysteine-rich repeat protein